MSWMSRIATELTLKGYSDEQIETMPMEQAWQIAVDTRTEHEKVFGGK